MASRPRPASLVASSCWTLAASVGITALLVASEPVFFAVRMAGAAYLVYLGATSLWTAWRGPSSGRQVVGAAGTPALAPGRALRQGFLSNLGNPKMVVFFSSLLPQFVPAGGPTFLPMLGLGLVFCTMTLVWLSGYAWLVARAGNVLRRPAGPRAIDAVTGTVLVGIRRAGRGGAGLRSGAVPRSAGVDDAEPVALGSSRMT